MIPLFSFEPKSVTSFRKRLRKISNNFVDNCQEVRGGFNGKVGDYNASLSRLHLPHEHELTNNANRHSATIYGKQLF